MSADDEQIDRRTLPRLVVVLPLLAAAVGAASGWLWYQWWGPPLQGQIFETTSGIRWYPDPFDPGQQQVFSGTAEYVVLGVLGGVVLGAVAVILSRRRYLLTLLVLGVASGIAATTMFVVGVALSPPDPDSFATSANVCRERPCEQFPAAIEVTGWTPFLSWTIGSLGTFGATIAALSGAREVRRHQSGRRETGNWLERPNAARSGPSARQ